VLAVVLYNANDTDAGYIMALAAINYTTAVSLSRSVSEK
jgi:hypothetical protein